MQRQVSTSVFSRAIFKAGAGLSKKRKKRKNKKKNQQEDKKNDVRVYHLLAYTYNQYKIYSHASVKTEYESCIHLYVDAFLC
jgi:hypothetical protein